MARRAKYLGKRKRGRPRKKRRGKAKPIDDLDQILELLENEKDGDGKLSEETHPEIARIRAWLEEPPSDRDIEAFAELLLPDELLLPEIPTFTAEEIRNMFSDVVVT